MKRDRGTRAAAALIALGLAVGCGSSQPSSPESSGRAGAAGRCHGTLGLEAVPLSRALRKRLALPKDFRGAVVGEVLPGGPAAAAGIRPDDVVETIGETRIGNDCDFDAAAFNRSCEPVRIVLRRDGGTVESTLAPVEHPAAGGGRARRGLCLTDERFVTRPG